MNRASCLKVKKTLLNWEMLKKFCYTHYRTIDYISEKEYA